MTLKKIWLFYTFISCLVVGCRHGVLMDYTSTSSHIELRMLILGEAKMVHEEVCVYYSLVHARLISVRTICNLSGFRVIKCTCKH
ncbi:hypothetical protein BRADI_3g36425v3 [Brachypodium distachyon]|uniref:Uncharacterized protein n=1 Tax=Brachypodium distachyon TaxID=15368 RepID=A0A2K2D1H6_BRADI|nr:hypothetical protein BRADI_3g36425v3 [Brachypodium distachyon]